MGEKADQQTGIWNPAHRTQNSARRYLDLVKQEAGSTSSKMGHPTHEIRFLIIRKDWGLLGPSSERTMGVLGSVIGALERALNRE